MARIAILADVVLQLNEDADVIRDGLVVVDGRRIEWVGKADDGMAAHGPFDEVLGGTNSIVMPGFFSAHHHIETAANRNHRWPGPLERRDPINMYSGPWSEEAVYWTNVYSNMRLLKAGITGVLAYFYGLRTLPDFGARSIMRAAVDSGLRMGLGIAARDHGEVVHSVDVETFLQRLPSALAERTRKSRFGYPYSSEEVEGVMRSLFSSDLYDSPRMRLVAAPDWTPNSTDEQYVHLKALADEMGLGVLAHLLETPLEAQFSHKAHGKSAVERLTDIGFLGPEVTCTDCVWLSKKDIQLFAESGATAVYSSFHVRGNGTAPVMEMRSNGIPVAFSILLRSLDDQYDSFLDLRLGEYLQRTGGVEAERISTPDMLRMGTTAGAQAWAMDSSIGEVSTGMIADLVVLDDRRMRDDPFLAPDIDPHDLVLYRGSARSVSSVVVDGRVIVREGVFLPISEEVVRANARRYCDAWRRDVGEGWFEPEMSLANELEPHMLDYYKEWELRELLRSLNPGSVKGDRIVPGT